MRWPWSKPDPAHERMMQVRRLAARLWFEDGGHVPFNGGGLIHEFMVQYPPTRMEYEGRAEAVLQESHSPDCKGHPVTITTDPPKRAYAGCTCA